MTRLWNASRHDQDGAGRSRAGTARPRSTIASASRRSIARCSTICWRSSPSTPDYDLDIMTEDQTLTEITTRVLTGMEARAGRGDARTSCSCTATRRRARRRRSPHFTPAIPVGHVEAGLRTRNRVAAVSRRDEPATNRHDRVVSISRRRSLAREHLLRENVAPDDVIVTGNTVIDAFARNGRGAPIYRFRRVGTRSIRSGRRFW